MVITKNKEKGVTLIALVLSVILILILAGISISMLTGQNGILNRTVEAVKKTNEQAEVEKIKMAVANYNIEKTMNSSLTFKEFCENNGLEDIKIIDENPSEEIQFIAEIDGKIFIMKSDGSYVRTKSKNLVKNGFGEEKFGGMEFKDGSFASKDSNYNQIYSNDFIEVDTNKKYYESIILKSNSKKADYSVGVAEYDIDKNVISAYTYLYTKNTLTYLERDLKDGDTEIYLNNIQNFSKKNLINGLDDGLIFWNYRDSTGFEYPEQTYSRNVFFSLFNSEDNFDMENNIIKLNKPWNGGTIKKGIKLNQTLSAATFNYGVMNGNCNVENKYQYYENYIEGVKGAEPLVTTKFRPATKYIKILILINYNNLPDITTNIKDIIFAEME